MAFGAARACLRPGARGAASTASILSSEQIAVEALEHLLKAGGPAARNNLNSAMSITSRAFRLRPALNGEKTLWKTICS
jgi:hypothetical protein